MTTNFSNDTVPEHLVGTRQGLFHLLRGTSIAPEEDHFAQAELPRVVRYKDVLLKQNASLRARRLEQPEADKVAKLMQDDEFCFIR